MQAVWETVHQNDDGLSPVRIMPELTRIQRVLPPWNSMFCELHRVTVFDVVTLIFAFVVLASHIV